MVLFGITYLRLDIFIIWWMNIFQSIVVLRHFVSLFVHRYMLRHTPFFERTRPFNRLSFTFWSSCWPLRVVYQAYASSLGSSDFSQASLFFFDLVVDPYELSYWGVSPSTEFASIVILVIIWLWATRSVIILSVQLEFWDHTYIDQSSSC